MDLLSLLFKKVWLPFFRFWRSLVIWRLDKAYLRRSWNTSLFWGVKQRTFFVGIHCQSSRFLLLFDHEFVDHFSLVTKSFLHAFKGQCVCLLILDRLLLQLVHIRLYSSLKVCLSCLSGIRSEIWCALICLYWEAVHTATNWYVRILKSILGLIFNLDLLKAEFLVCLESETFYISIWRLWNPPDVECFFYGLI